MALGDLGDLLGMHEHALDLGGLVGAAEPALDAHVGAPARARARQHRRQVAGGEADHRVVAVEGGDHHLADLARRHRIAGARPHDLDDHALVDDHALERRALVGDDAEVGGGVGLDRWRCRAALYSARSEGNSAPPPTSAFLMRGGVLAGLLGLVEQDLQVVRHADVGGGLQRAGSPRAAARCCRGRPRSRRSRARARRHRGSSRRASGDRRTCCARCRPCGCRRRNSARAARHQSSPRPSGSKIGPGRHEDARQRAGRRRWQSRRTAGRLACRSLQRRLAQHRQLGQRLARGRPRRHRRP